MLIYFLAMEALTRRANTLFLRGVSLADLGHRDDIFDKKFTSCDAGTTQRVIYQALPEHFTTLELWPRSTNLKCWQCDCSFSTIPIFVPTDMYVVGGQRVMDTHGNFCTFNCAQAYINEKFKGEPSRYDKDTFLKIEYAMFTQKQTDYIVPSTPKTRMQQYCGEGGLTYQAYRDEIYRMSADYELTMFKLSQFSTQ